MDGRATNTVAKTSCLNEMVGVEPARTPMRRGHGFESVFQRSPNVAELDVSPSTAENEHDMFENDWATREEFNGVFF